MREFRTMGQPVNFEVEIYDKCKYTREAQVEGPQNIVKYYDVETWEIVDGEDAAVIEAESDGSCIDEFHEYLVLHFVDGGTSTFRNSHVDLFRVPYEAWQAKRGEK